jgi:hypothetical protein
MSVRAHILFMLAATVSAWIAWLLVIVSLNPQEVAWWGFLIFYATLFLSIFGTFTVLGFTIRSLIRRKRMTLGYKTVTSLRQSFFWSLALIIVLAVQSQRLLNWWNFFLVIVGFSLLEFFIATISNQRVSQKND